MGIIVIQKVKKMKHYKDYPILIGLNILFEYVLLIINYLICSIIRIYIPVTIARAFWYQDIIDFLPSVLLYFAVVILAYGILGDYGTLHYRSAKWEIRRIVSVQILGGILFSALLYLTEGNQFSRLLLIMIMISSSFLLLLKRILFSHLADLFFKRKLQAYQVLLLGNGENARRYYRGMKENPQIRYQFAGYAAKSPVEAIPNYLGTYEQLYDILNSKQINQVVIADEEVDRKFLYKTLSICNMFGIEAYIVPVFSDFLISGQSIQSYNDLPMISVSADNTNNILGVNIAVTNMSKTIQDITDNLEEWRGKYICVSNVHTTIMAHENESYQKVQNDAVMALPDGGPLSSYSRSVGRTEARRVTGPDLMREILRISGEHGWKHFFYGSSPKTLAMLKDKLRERYPGAEVVGMISPPYRELTPEEESAYVEQINAANPDFVWVGLGAPKQEIWMAAHKDRVHALMIGVGAAFDYESGNLKRAPKWMQRCNLEWLYRFLQEPKRLFKRYLITNLKFIWLTRK